MAELRQCLEPENHWLNAERHTKTRPVSGGWDQRESDWQLRLMGIIEGEILPRLMLTYRVVANAASPDVKMPGEAQVLELAQMVVSRDLSSATRYIQEMRENGVPTDALLLDLLAPAARYLGEMWDKDLCNFLDVTVGLSRLHMLLNELDPGAAGEIAEPEERQRILLMPTPGEQHTFGIQMVEKFFRTAGWEVFGVEHRDEDVVELTQREWFAIVGLSLASETKLDTLATAIRAIRRVSQNQSIAIMVGGPLFLERPELVNLIGADATAADGQVAVMLGQQIVLRQQGSAKQRCGP
jgi:methanogenic corrinoid protein MtbC1